jgi:hypothetical protein
MSANKPSSQPDDAYKTIASTFVDKKFLMETIVPIQDSLKRLSSTIALASKIQDGGILNPSPAVDAKVRGFYDRSMREPFFADVGNFGHSVSNGAIEQHLKAKQEAREAFVMTEPRSPPFGVLSAADNMQQTQKTRVYVIPHSHTDLGWLQTLEVYFDQCSLALLMYRYQKHLVVCCAWSVY